MGQFPSYNCSGGRDGLSGGVVRAATKKGRISIRTARKFFNHRRSGLVVDEEEAVYSTG